MSTPTALPRLSQRRSLTCQECARRKVRCDKRIPCSRCIRLSMPCSREVVRLSKAVNVHRNELSFLRNLTSLIEDTKDLDTATAAVRQRLESLEHGLPTSSTPLNETHNQVEDSSPSTNATMSPLATSISNSDEQHASKVRTVELLAWGRHAGTCFPHRRCQCRSIRPYAEVISINADLRWTGITKTLAELPQSLILPYGQARALIQFHFDNILWHHNVFHAPTFLAQCEEFWTENTVSHPLWIALYLSVLSVSLWTALNSGHHPREFDIDEAMPHLYFQHMVQVLYRENFLENLSLFSIQAIALSTRIAHNLGQSDLNATLGGAAIRIAHCLGIHQINSEAESLNVDTVEGWYTTVEIETGRRCWLQLVIQDYFQIPFTNAHLINPSHYSTELPRNCHDEEMIELNDEIPTINSYIRTLARIASIMPSMLTGVDPRFSRFSLTDTAKHIDTLDRAFRHVVQDLPTFLLREVQTENDHACASWLPVARRSLAITAADKIITIHKPILYHSFHIPALSRNRTTCVAAAMTILQQHEAVTRDSSVSLWTHSAFCVTAVMVIGLSLLFHDNHSGDEAGTLRTCLFKTGQRLKNRRCDLIAERGVALIETVLALEEEVVLRVMRFSSQETSVTGTQLDVVARMIEGNEMMAKFLALRPDNTLSAVRESGNFQSEEVSDGYLAAFHTDAYERTDGGLDPFFSDVFSSWASDLWTAI